MIVLDDSQTVIITPPHTASGNLHRALCGPPHNGRWVCGPSPSGVWMHHVVDVPTEWRHYRRLLVVREPLNRLVGLWLHYSWAVRDGQVTSGRTDLTWPAFVLAVAEDHPGYLSWLYRWTITRLIEPVDRLDGTIRYERLANDLSGAVGNVDLAPPYHASPDLSDWFGDSRIRQLAEAWAQPDRLRFGYSHAQT